MLSTDSIVAGAGIFVLGTASAFYMLRWRDRGVRAQIKSKQEAMFDDAKRQAEAIIREARLEANEHSLKLRTDTEAFAAQRQKELSAVEQRLIERETILNRQLDNLVQQEKLLRNEKEECDVRLVELQHLRAEAADLVLSRRQQLACLAKLNEADVRAAFSKQIEQEAQRDAAKLCQRILEDAKTNAEEKARHIIANAILRYGGEYTTENSTCAISITNDEIKGRIIGREGRNIRSFEAATGVTVLIDDTPGSIVLSGFDPVRREIAREAMQRLILDGRIHPARIEEVVAKVSQEMDEMIQRCGNDAVIKLGLAPMHPEIVKLLGRLHFRRSFTQNLLQHSVEVAHIMGLLAGEIGVDVATAKRAGLLHDIGKAMNHEVEGPHAIVGADFIKRHGESPDVVTGVASHHGEAEKNLLGVLVGAADAISAARPGARSETILTYIKRVEDLERIGLSFEGVEKCFALQAGRELRVLVQPEKITDDEAFVLARNVAKKIEEELQYPGQIKITVVRETRCVELAT
ncbi:MAG: metal dependent phosphohydrolase [Verrucomicrobiales bacterium]|nr:metal dependent phosphohydrolase [Verrucomicrobiales bacterium]